VTEENQTIAHVIEIKYAHSVDMSPSFYSIQV